MFLLSLFLVKTLVLATTDIKIFVNRIANIGTFGNGVEGDKINTIGSTKVGMTVIGQSVNVT